MDIIVKAWDWFKLNDLSNWFAIVLWPLILFLWNQKTVDSIPNLEVSLSKGTTKIGENEVTNALCLNFLNNTASIVYLTNAHILKCSKLFPVDPAASRDIAKSSHELKFPNFKDSYLTERQIILHTNAQAGTCLSLTTTVTDAMISYKPNIIRKLFHIPKYFCLEYVAMVGNKRYKVSTIY